MLTVKVAHQDRSEGPKVNGKEEKGKERRTRATQVSRGVTDGTLTCDSQQMVTSVQGLY